MVNGLDLFREHFADFTEAYCIIGGTACSVQFEPLGISFRSTKDIDIVLLLESFDQRFAAAMWGFINQGGYQNYTTRQGDQRYYRFHKPKDQKYPFMLELLSRVPDFIKHRDLGHLTPIPVGSEVDSLSAILLDEAYYAWIKAGRLVTEGLPVVSIEHLIPPKAKAWLDLSARKRKGEAIRGDEIKKHKNDVFRLYSVANPTHPIADMPAIRADMKRFIDAMRSETLALDRLGLAGMDQNTVLDDLLARYGPRA